MRVLGLSAFYHDSAAALVVDGTIAAAAQEERFTRKKNDAEFPRAAVAYCLEAGGVELDEVDQVVFYDKPLLKFERLIETYQAFAPKGLSSFRTALPIWLREKLFQERLLRDELRRFARGFKPAGKLVFRLRSRQSDRDRAGDSFPAFAWSALLGLHLLSRFQGQRR
jgi:carbamoyltransferase